MTQTPPTQPLSVPVDAGLTGLGLLIRAMAGVGLALGVIGTMTMPVMGASAGVNAFFWLFVVGAVIRAAIHLNVGDHASRRSPGVVRASLVYLIAAGVHSGLFLAGVLSERGGLVPDLFVIVAGFLVLSLGWPVSLYVLVRRRALRAAFDAADTFDTSLVPADRGLSAAGALMLGFSGATLGVPLHLALVLLAQRGPHAPSHWLLLLGCAVFLARGVTAFRLGLDVHRGKIDMQVFRSRLRTYRGIAIVSVAALAIGLLSVADVRRLLGASPLLSFIILASAVAATWVWPSVLGRFAAQLDAEDATDGELTAVPPSPDAGALTVGQFLVATGWVALGIVLMAGGALAMVPALDDSPVAELLGSGEVFLITLATAGVLVNLALGGALASLGRATRAIVPLTYVLVGLLAAEIAASLVGSVGSGDGLAETLGGALDSAFGLVAMIVLLGPIARRARGAASH